MCTITIILFPYRCRHCCMLFFHPFGLEKERKNKCKYNRWYSVVRKRLREIISVKWVFVVYECLYISIHYIFLLESTTIVYLLLNGPHLFSDGRTTCPLSFDSFCTKTKSSFSKIKCARTTNNVYVFVNVATNPNKYVLNSYNIIQSNRFQNTNRRWRRYKN